MLAFDTAFSQQPPEDFVQRRAASTPCTRGSCFVGSDFRFGAKGSGTVETLTAAGAEHGFEVRLVDEVRAREGRRASSTWVRELLAAGNVARGRPSCSARCPTVRSVVVHGRAARPGARLSDREPRARSGGAHPRRRRLCRLAQRRRRDATRPRSRSATIPTFEGVPARQVEAYVLDRDIDLYGKTVEVSFVDYIRGDGQIRRASTS